MAMRFTVLCKNSDLYWLCGIEQEDTMLILFPDHPNHQYREVLVLVRPIALKEKWDGKRLRAAEATAISGIETVLWLDSIDALLQTWIHLANIIYLKYKTKNDRKGNWLETRDYRFAQQMQQRYPLHRYERSAKIMRELRAIKTKYEIEVVQQAINITEKAFRRLLAFIKPGVMEYEIEAEIIHEFCATAQKEKLIQVLLPVATGHARCIIYLIMRSVKNGELILMDFGANYGGYAADLTRTVPVNGKFTKRQKSCLQCMPSFA